MEKAIILGAGLVGSLAAILLARRGIQVSVFERRSATPLTDATRSRSINMALSERGWAALRRAGVANEVHDMTVPMHGRMIHSLDGHQLFQPYGRAGQSIYSVSREKLNALLTWVAQQQPNVSFVYNHPCLNVDLDSPAVYVHDLATDKKYWATADLVLGADGASSVMRRAFKDQYGPDFVVDNHYIDYGYKELTIPALPNGEHRLDPNCLHIWPRETFMLIALPNADGTFTGTLFLPYIGPFSFAGINNLADMTAFFSLHFPDMLPYLPALAQSYGNTPPSRLNSVRCAPWTHEGKAALIGDSAHTILPFYGQGMNSGFEDCLVLDDLIDACADDWEQILPAYEQNRKPNADVIDLLSKQNFVEMRSRVNSPQFVLRKQIEARIGQQCPESWTPLYSMVAFSTIPLTDALTISNRQSDLLDSIMAMPNIQQRWKSLDYAALLTGQAELAFGYEPAVNQILTL